MVIEARQRSPLGAPYRSPLGAFGGETVKPPPVTYDWYVDTVSVITPPDSRGLDGACATGVVQDTGNGRLHILLPNTIGDYLPPGAENAQVVFTGQTSGFQYIWTGVRDCTVGNNSPAIRFSHPGTYSPYAALGLNFEGGNEVVQFDGNSYGHLGFVVGEQVVVTTDEIPPPPKNVINGTVTSAVISSAERRVDYSDCSRASVVAGSGSNFIRIQLSSGDVPNNLTADAFRGYTVLGQISGVSFVVSQFGLTYICGDGAQYPWTTAYYNGGRNNIGGDVWVHEYLSEITNGADYDIWGARRFGGSLPALIQGEAVTLTAP